MALVTAFAHRTITDLHDVSVAFSNDSNDVAIYNVTGGPPQDCLAGCFYGGGFVLRHGQKLGWITAYGGGITLVPGTTVADYPPYALSSDDAYLFSADAEKDLRNLWIFGYFRLMLTADSATPLSTLELMANNLSTDGWPVLADYLLDVAVARHDRAVVEAVATVSGQMWNFSSERARASKILQTWQSSN